MTQEKCSGICYYEMRLQSLLVSVFKREETALQLIIIVESAHSTQQYM